jgi:hypothetical protein
MQVRRMGKYLTAPSRYDDPDPAGR